MLCAASALPTAEASNAGEFSSGFGMSMTSRVIAMAKTASVKKPTRSGVRPGGIGRSDRARGIMAAAMCDTSRQQSWNVTGVYCHDLLMH